MFKKRVLKLDEWCCFNKSKIIYKLKFDLIKYLKFYLFLSL